MSLDIPLWILLITFFVLALGSMVQSIAGMGFGMVVVPVISLMIGSADGVFLGNIAGLAISGMLTITKRKDTEWNKAGILLLCSIPGVIVTAALLSQLPGHWLDFVVGGLMVALVIFSVIALRFRPVSGLWPLAATGFVSGILSTTVAQSGPVMAAYAQATRWKQANFAATLQPYFFMLNLVVIPSKLYTGLGNISFLTPAFVIASVAVIIVSSLFATKYATRVPAKVARSLALIIAGAGALIIFLRGVFAIV